MATTRRRFDGFDPKDFPGDPLVDSTDVVWFFERVRSGGTFRRMTTPGILAAALAALLAGTAAAQILQRAGYWSLEPPGGANASGRGEFRNFEVELLEGLDYAIHGECSADCDLLVRDPDGAVVGEDAEFDPIPSVNVTAERSGRFGVEVSCPSEECDALVRTEEIRVGELGEDDEANFAVRLSAGMKYRFSGVCDLDCSDLDLLVQDSGGETVAEDVLPDDFPLVEFKPDQSGDFTLVVRMSECSVEPCLFRVLASPAEPLE